MPYKLISSAQNEEIKTLARWMQQPRERRQANIMLLEGIHLLQACLAHGGQPQRVYIQLNALHHPEVQALIPKLQREQIVTLPAAILSKLSSLTSASELIAICPRPQPKPIPAEASCVLLEDIQDPGNLGTILRSMAAANVTELFLSPGCADVYSPKVLRAAMGAHFVLNIHEQADLAEVLQHFTGRKFVTHLAASQSLYQQDLSASVAFIFGNEGAGVSSVLSELADHRICIPMPGQAESLNVAMAATVCLFERVRQKIAT